MATSCKNVDESHKNNVEQKTEDIKGNVEYGSIDIQFSDRQTVLFFFFLEMLMNG